MNQSTEATLIPKDRYTSTEFAALELARMWPRVWQIACSLDHVSGAGDFFEYRFGPYSVVVVRGDDGELRAFQNVCRHRGNSICSGAGRGLSELRCGYHRWAWNLCGDLREIPSRKDFGPLTNDEYALVPARVDTWGPLVFVNLDASAMPLDEYLEAVPDDIAWVGLDDFRCEARVVTPVAANWKIVVDGFSETYHVQGIHPEMLGSMDDVHTEQRVWGHTSKSAQDYGVPSPRLGHDVSDQHVWDSFVATQGARMGITEPCPMPPLRNGQSVGDAIAAGIRRTQAAEGVDLSRFDTEQMLRLQQYNLFPNSTVLTTPDLLSVLCALPGATPDEADMVFFHFRRAPSEAAARSNPVDAVVPPDQANFGYVLNADLRILASVQRGIRQPGLTHLTVSAEECRVVNTHRNLERYVSP
jgi:phenylpropionate dioxygenase-like ring-hydroxylating dioxygenase large terminal subunit